MRYDMGVTPACSPDTLPIPPIISPVCCCPPQATLEDVMVRYARMCGRNALWVPGTDHAGIATQVRLRGGGGGGTTEAGMVQKHRCVAALSLPCPLPAPCLPSLHPKSPPLNSECG